MYDLERINIKDNFGNNINCNTFDYHHVSINTIQFLAIVFMITDHIGKFFYPQFIILQIIGRLGMPLWPFFIYFGFSHTSNIDAYKKRVLIIAILSQLPFQYLAGNHINPVFSLFMGLAIISTSDYKKSLIIYLLSWILYLTLGMDAFFFNGILVFRYIHKNHHFTAMFCLFLVLSLVDHPFQIFSIFGMYLITLPFEFLPRLPKIVKLGIYPVHYFIMGVFSWLLG